jgi:uncharacterized protein (DUF1499 family)
MILAWLCFYDAIIAALTVGAGIAGAHFGLIAPFSGFQMMMVGLGFAAMGLITGLIALPMTIFSPKMRPAMSRAVTGTIIVIALLTPVSLVVAETKQFPMINDVTTDTEHPPVFVAAIELQSPPGRDMTYKPQIAAIQKAAPAYNDLEPLKMDGSPDEVFSKAAILAGQVPSWKITRNDPQTHTLEGVATSPLFKLHDDFIIEVRPAEGGGSLVEMRSKSRDGQGDFGTNHNRIISFLHLLKTGPQTPPPGSPQVQP